jgi:hypothetical protein
MQDIPKHVRAVKLFDGMDLNGFDTFLTKEGLAIIYLTHKLNRDILFLD